MLQQHGGEAEPLVDGIRPANAIVRILGDHVVTGALGERLDGFRWRLSVSLSSPTFVIDDVRK